MLREITVCPICWESPKQLARLARVVPCGHVFCFRCIRKWTREHHQYSCPMCRVKLPERRGLVPLDSELISETSQVWQASTPTKRKVVVSEIAVRWAQQHGFERDEGLLIWRRSVYLLKVQLSDLEMFDASMLSRWNPVRFEQVEVNQWFLRECFALNLPEEEVDFVKSIFKRCLSTCRDSSRDLVSVLSDVLPDRDSVERFVHETLRLLMSSLTLDFYDRTCSYHHPGGTPVSPAEWIDAWKSIAKEFES